VARFIKERLITYQHQTGHKCINIVSTEGYMTVAHYCCAFYILELIADNLKFTCGFGKNAFSKINYQITT